MRQRFQRLSAFTLIELLVVMAIMSVLVGLLLAAVQHAREAARRIACASNLRQIGLALANYHDANRCFPPGMVDDAKGNNLQKGGSSGFVPLLPFLEQGDWLQRWNPNTSWYTGENFVLVSNEIKTFFCPSNRTGGTIDLSFLDGPAGQTMPDPAACDYLLCKGTNAALCRVVKIPLEQRGVFDVNTSTRVTDITDGASNTIAVGEGAGNNPRYLIRRFYQDNFPATDLFPGQPIWIDQSWSSGPMATAALHSLGFLFGSCFGVTAERGGQTPVFDEPMNNSLALPAVDYDHGCTNSNPEPGECDSVSGFRSVHNAGCNFLFCDGSVRFVGETITTDAYRAISTMAGGEVVQDSF